MHQNWPRPHFYGHIAFKNERGTHDITVLSVSFNQLVDFHEI
jgi:hypothetical protein